MDRDASVSNQGRGEPWRRSAAGAGLAARPFTEFLGPRHLPADFEDRGRNAPAPSYCLGDFADRIAFRCNLEIMIAVWRVRVRGHRDQQIVAMHERPTHCLSTDDANRSIAPW